jgi:hypothetical protein
MKNKQKNQSGFQQLFKPSHHLPIDGTPNRGTQNSRALLLILKWVILRPVDHFSHFSKNSSLQHHRGLVLQLARKPETEMRTAAGRGSISVKIMLLRH